MTTKKKMMNHVLITHNDLDGFGNKFLADTAFGEHVYVYTVANNKVDKTISTILEKEVYKEASIWITDVTPETEEVALLLEEAYRKGRKITLIDHHASALALNRFDWANITVYQEDGKQTSATSLFYQYLVEKGLLTSTTFLDSFVEHVRLYDTWEWKKEDVIKPKHLNDLFFILGMKSFQESLTKKAEQSDQAFSFTENEIMILNIENRKIESYIQRKSRYVVPMEWEGFTLGVIYAEQYISELGNDLAERFLQLDAIAILNPGSRKVSLRTIHEDVNVFEIAVRFGGGGHKAAAGFSIDEEVFQLFIQNTYFGSYVPLDVDNRYNLKDTFEETYYMERDDVFIIQKTGQNVYSVLRYNQTTTGKKVLLANIAGYREAERFVKKQYDAVLMEDALYIPLKAAQHGITEQRLRSQYLQYVS